MCYEVKQHVGGLWNSKDETPDEFYSTNGYNLESIYQELVSIVPFMFMQFKDFPSKHESSHLTRQEFETYLNDYCQHFKLEHYIQFSTFVTKIETVGPKK